MLADGISTVDSHLPGIGEENEYDRKNISNRKGPDTLLDQQHGRQWTEPNLSPGTDR